MTSSSISWIWANFGRPIRHRILLALILNFLVLGVELISVTLLVIWVSLLSGSPVSDSHPIFGVLLKPFDFFSSSTQQQVLILSYILLFVLFVKSVVTFIHYKFLIVLSEKSYQLLVSRILEKYSRLRYDEFLKEGPSAVQKVVVSEAYNFSNVISAVLSAASELILFVALSSYLIAISPFPITVALGSLLVGFFLLNRIISKRITIIGAERERNLLELYRGTSDTFKNYKYLYSNNLFRYHLDNIRQSSTRWSELGVKYGILAGLPRIFIEGLAYFSLILVVLIGRRVDGLDSPDFLILISSFVVVMMRLLPSVNRLISQINIISYNGKSIFVLKTLFEAQCSAQAEQRFFYLNGARFKRLVLKDAVVSSPSGDFLYTVERFVVNRGDRVAILGSSGCGKSTLLDVLMGVHPRPFGTLEVLFDDTSSKCRYESLFGCAHYISQRVHLFQGTLYENIASGSVVNLSKCDSLIESFELMDLQKSLSKGNGRIKEDALNMSGGQAQRIGIARALYSDSKVLVFDEPTAALDADSALTFTKLLFELPDYVTVILVTHDTRVASLFKKRFKIEGGQLSAC